MDRRDDGAKPGKKPTSTLRRNLNTKSCGISTSRKVSIAESSIFALANRAFPKEYTQSAPPAMDDRGDYPVAVSNSKAKLTPEFP